MEGVEDDWIFYGILLYQRNVLISQIDQLIKQKRKYKKPYFDRHLRYCLDKEARYVKEKYKTISFPFKEISVPVFKTTLYWNLHQLWDYMKTWSSVKKYYSENKRNPLDLVKLEVKDLWGNDFDKKEVTWNINMRAGVIK